MKNTIKKKIKTLIKESTGGVDIVVDIQPEYMNGINFMDEWVNYVNENASSKRIILLYNGANTVGDMDESEYQNWLLYMGVDEDALYELEFYDKGYAFFRTHMDEGVDVEEIITVLKYMISQNYNDIRDIKEEEWEELSNEYDLDDLIDVAQSNDGSLYIPDVLDYLKSFNGINLMGGGEYECLAEVEIILELLGKNYNRINEFIY